MKILLLILLLIPGLSFGLTFKDGKQVDDKNSIDSLLIEINANDLKVPKNYYTNDELTIFQSCPAYGNTVFSSNSTKEYLEGFVGYDWASDWKKNSNSLNVHHQRITGPIKEFLIATHNAVSSENENDIFLAKEFAIKIAQADTLYNSIGYEAVKKKPGCYANGDINAPCWYHQYSFAREVFGNFIIAAVWLKPFFSETEFEIVNKYIKKMYVKFIQPAENNIEERGFYAMANGGLNILAYANWIEDKNLAAKEINLRFQEIDTLFYEDGYINNNSFRGVRAQWYHSYGLNPALAYAFIANLWGAEVPDQIINKLIKASELVNLAILDRESFLNRNFEGENNNITTDPSKAIWHTHQHAIAINTLMKLVTEVEMVEDTMWDSKRARVGIDETIGFNPQCLSCKPSRKLVFKKGTNTPEMMEVCE
jgi:hypothetical protein